MLLRLLPLPLVAAAVCHCVSISADDGTGHSGTRKIDEIDFALSGSAFQFHFVRQLLQLQTPSIGYQVEVLSEKKQGKTRPLINNK